MLDLLRCANNLKFDADRFHEDLKRHIHAARIAQDVESADLSAVSGTLTFFINGQRHYRAFDIQTHTAAIKTARAQLQAPGVGRM